MGVDYYDYASYILEAVVAQCESGWFSLRGRQFESMFEYLSLMAKENIVIKPCVSKEVHNTWKTCSLQPALGQRDGL